MSTHSAFQSNATNAWNFNGTNGNLNTNNARINSNASRLLRDFCERVKERRDLPPLTIQALYRWYYIARQGKRSSPSQAEFEIRHPEMLREILSEVIDREYIPWPGILFILRWPVLRECSAPVFRDRPVETMFCESIRPAVEAVMDPDSYACRVGKGSIAAAQQLAHYWRLESENGRYPCVWVSLDQKSFFFHLYKPLVRRIFDAIIDRYLESGEYKDMMLYLSRIITEGSPIEHAVRQCGIHEWNGLAPHKQQKNLPPDVGMSIGRLPVQLAGALVSAMSYLAILREYGYTRFVHYTDDVKIPLREDRLQGFLHHFMPELRKREAMFGLELNERKTAIQPDRHGVVAFGYFIKPVPMTDAMRRRGIIQAPVLVYPTRRIVDNIERRIAYYLRRGEDRLYRLRHKEQLVARMNSYMGILRHANAYNLRKSYCERLMQSPWRDVLEIRGDCLYLAIRKHYTRRAYLAWKNRQLKQLIRYEQKREDPAA